MGDISSEKLVGKNTYSPEIDVVIDQISKQYEWFDVVKIWPA